MEITFVCNCGKALEVVNVSLGRHSDVPEVSLKPCEACLDAWTTQTQKAMSAVQRRQKSDG